MNLETKYAESIIAMLEDAQDIGMAYVVFEMQPMERGLEPRDLDFFDTLGAALDHWEAKSGYGYLPGDQHNPVYYRSIEQLLEEIKTANSLTKQNIMNRNNLENLTEEMKTLGLGDKEIAKMEEMMQKNLSEFQLRTKIPGNKGVVDTVLYFKQSNQSENYYLNKYHVTLNKAKQLDEGQKYLVITNNPGGQGPEKLFRSFESPYEAVAYFKEEKGKSELAVGEQKGRNWAISYGLATREDGKTSYVAKDFSKTFHAPVQDQTFFVEKGKGFTVEQAANMIQGRSVYRDDLLNIGGVPYKAWMKLDMDGAKDRHGNYMLNQYNDPAYGFHIANVLDSYKIKEIATPEQKEALITELKNGNRPLITTVKDGEEVKLHLEAVPRYSQVNFYQENGKPERREQFEKAAEKAKDMTAGKGKAKATAKQEGQGIEM
jgi:hypothetical protein